MASPLVRGRDRPRPRRVQLRPSSLPLPPSASRSHGDRCPRSVRLDIANYTIDARLDGSHRVITATATLRWTNTSSRPARELWWHLYMNAFANRDTLFMRTGGDEGTSRQSPRSVRQHRRADHANVVGGRSARGRSENDPTVPHDATQLRTSLSAPVPPGRTIEIVMSFRTRLPDAFARSGAWRDFAFAGQWFPKIAVLRNDGQWAHFPFHANTEFFADFGRYDVTLHVPHGDIVAATGVEVEPAANGSSEDLHHYGADAVHDFAWTAWREFRERDDTINGIQVRTLFPPGGASVAARAVASLVWSMPDFRARFGPYPYPNLTVVLPPRQAHGVGGMEYPTLITIDGEWLEPRSERQIEWVTVHEYAHQYFYGLLASDEWSWPFLDEGFADYASGLAMGDHFGVDREFWDGLGLTLGYWAFEGRLRGGHQRRHPGRERLIALSGLLLVCTARVSPHRNRASNRGTKLWRSGDAQRVGALHRAHALSPPGAKRLPCGCARRRSPWSRAISTQSSPRRLESRHIAHPRRRPFIIAASPGLPVVVTAERANGSARVTTIAGTAGELRVDELQALAQQPDRASAS